MWAIGNGWLSHNPPNQYQPFITLLFLVKLCLFIHFIYLFSHNHFYYKNFVFIFGKYGGLPVYCISVAYYIVMCGAANRV